MGKQKTALTQLEKWILDYEKVNGTPTMCEIKAQIEMLKEIEKEQIVNAFSAIDGFENLLKEYAEKYCNETYTQSSE